MNAPISIQVTSASIFEINYNNITGSGISVVGDHGQASNNEIRNMISNSTSILSPFNILVTGLSATYLSNNLVCDL